MSTFSSTSRGYSVEARLNYHTPKEINGKLLDKQWRLIEFERVPAGLGIPSHGAFDHGLRIEGLVTYPAAEALRWWFIANARIGYEDTYLETRIVEHEIKLSCASKKTSVGCVIGEDSGRRNGYTKFEPAPSDASEGEPKS